MVAKKAGKPAKKAAKKVAKRKPAGLNHLQSMFVREYLIDLNATAAYKRAGYSGAGNVAESAAARLLRNVQVASAIKNAMDSRASKLELTAERVLQEVARIAFFDVRKVYDAAGNLKAPGDWDDDIAAAMAGLDVTEEFTGKGEARESSGFTKKVKAWDKVSALTLAMRHKGMLNDKLELGGKVSGEIVYRANIPARNTAGGR